MSISFHLPAKPRMLFENNLGGVGLFGVAFLALLVVRGSLKSRNTQL